MNFIQMASRPFLHVSVCFVGFGNNTLTNMGKKFEKVKPKFLRKLYKLNTGQMLIKQYNIDI